MENGVSTRTGPPSSGCYAWWAHVAILVLVAGFIGLSLWQSTPDANIGLGLGMLTLGAMGLPWTLPILWHDGVTTDSALFVVVAVGGALLNVLLHALAWRHRSGRGSA